MIQRWIAATIVVVVMTVSGACPGFAELSCNGEWITDSMGRRISTRQSFERIISLYGAHTENLFSLGAGKRIIGVSPHEDWPLEAKKKTVYSYHDGLEKFLSDRPDLIIIRPMIDRGYRQLVSRLEAQGITVVSLQPKTVDQLFVYWKILGKLSGCEPSSRQMTTTFMQTVDRIKKKTTAVDRKKRVYFEAIHDRMRTFTPSAMAIFVLETAGGVNVADQAVSRKNTVIAEFGKERILSLADEIDVYLAQLGPMNQPTIAMIKTEPGFHLIRAVREDQVYLIEERLVSRPTMRLIDGICRIAQVLYPGLFLGDNDILDCTHNTTYLETSVTNHWESKP